MPAQRSKSKLAAQRTQQLRSRHGETPAENARGICGLAAADSWAREAGPGSQTMRPKPLFSGRLAAMLALQRKLKLGTPRNAAVLYDCSLEATGSVDSTPGREASLAAQRPELSSEDQQLLQRAASGPEPMPSLSVDLSAFADMPAIPAWRTTAPKPLDGTLRKTFTIKRTEAAEEVSQDAAEP